MTEVLVAVGVMALIAGIALPVLGGVRRSGAAVASLTRMKDIGMFVADFADTHRDEMPRSAHSYLGSGMRPWAYAYYEFTLGDPEYDDPERWLEFVDRYLRCPLDDRTDRYPSFGYNVYFELTEAENDGRSWRHSTLPPRPSVTVLHAPLKSSAQADHVMAHFWESLDPEDYEVEPARFGTGSGYLYLDGHTSSAEFDSVYTQDDPSINQFDPAGAR